MSVSRLENITKIGVEEMGNLADQLDSSEILRLENLDTDLSPPKSAINYTKQVIGQDDANSYLPFLGLDSLRKSATSLVQEHSNQKYDWKTESVVSAGGLSGILNVLLATLEPGDEVLMTDPIYVGLINRVRLAGGIPRFVPLIPTDKGWRLDTDKLKNIDHRKVSVALLMSPSMPTGSVFTKDEWNSLVHFCKRADCWLINDTAMERILYNDSSLLHPASFSGMREKVITVGSASKEYRMIGWRVGWVVGPKEIITDVARVSISNVVCQTGIAMGAVAKAISSDDDKIEECVSIWKSRRNLLMKELSDFDVIPPDGGWSFLINVSTLGMDGQEASKRLIKKENIAATPMVNWGSESSKNYLRIVFSNEPMERLEGIGKRFENALA